jgi:hypothetical protein
MLSFFSFLVYAQDICSPDKSGNSCCVDGVPTLKCLENIFGNLLNLATGIFLLALFIMLVVGAFNYLTSFGNPEKVKKAQGTLKFAFIGLILFLGSYLILNIICFVFNLYDQSGKCKLLQFSIDEIPAPRP